MLLRAFHRQVLYLQITNFKMGSRLLTHSPNAYIEEKKKNVHYIVRLFSRDVQNFLFLSFNFKFFVQFSFQNVFLVDSHQSIN